MKWPLKNVNLALTLITCTFYYIVCGYAVVCQVQWSSPLWL